MTTLHFEAGRVWGLHELPDRSLALDGAVLGPSADFARRVYSFDHHGPTPRHAMRSTCEQVFDALAVGLDPRGYRVYVNDVDADVVLSVWMLQHPEAVRQDLVRVGAVVRAVGRVDALGPAVGPAVPLHSALTSAGPPSRGALARALRKMDRGWRGERLPLRPSLPPCRAMWVEQGRLVRGLVRGFAGLYAHAPFGVLVGAAPFGTRAYTVGKVSEFVDFDVQGFLALCGRREPGWGGGSTVGGAPRREDGSRSRLGEAEVGRVLLEVASRSRQCVRRTARSLAAAAEPSSA